MPAHSVTSSLLSPIRDPFLCEPDAQKSFPCGHSMVNIISCSSVIKRNSVSSEMLEVPYGERNIIISLSSSYIHALTVLLKPQGPWSQSPNRGNSSWEYSPGTCSQRFRPWLPRTAPHLCPACLCMLQARAQWDVLGFSQQPSWSPGQRVIILPKYRWQAGMTVQNHPADRLQWGCN